MSPFSSESTKSSGHDLHSRSDRILRKMRILGLRGNSFIILVLHIPVNHAFHIIPPHIGSPANNPRCRLNRTSWILRLCNLYGNSKTDGGTQHSAQKEFLWNEKEIDLQVWEQSRITDLGDILKILRLAQPEANGMEIQKQRVRNEF